MIVYRKADALRVVRATAPLPPFWARTTLAPYGALREQPIAIDYVHSAAAAETRLEVTVCREPEAQFDAQLRPIPAPILIDAAGAAEPVFRRGDTLSRRAAAAGLPAALLVSTEGDLPEDGFEGVLVLATWPAEREAIHALFSRAEARGLTWGAVIPVIFPLTTSLETLSFIADEARRCNARFLAAMPIDLEPSAKHAIAQMLPRTDTDDYDTLFHAELETITIATERHVAALARERDLVDFVMLPGEGRTNWDAAAMLARAGSRMIRMNRDVELGWQLLRESRVVAELEKPLERIGRAAPLSIIEPLDDIAVDALTQWLDNGRSDFVDGIDDAWRLRRDYTP